jgi:hypothetical protein
MAPFTLLTARDAKRFHELANRMPRAEGLEFLEHDGAVAQFWPRLNASFPENQFCLIDEGTGIAAGIGKSITLAFDGTWADLPTEGLDWAVEKGFADRAAGRTPNLMSALYIEIAETHRGQHLSAQMLAAMREIARSQGFQTLIAPVRPSLKSRYLLIDIQTYLAWTTPEGLPFDPWLRVHARSGGHVLHPCPRAMVVKGTRAQWAEWTGMAVPGDGDYIIPYGLVPVRVRGDLGEYIEPGVWVLHEIL